MVLRFDNVATISETVTVLRSVVEPGERALMARYALTRLGAGAFAPERSNHSSILGGDPLVEAVLDSATEAASEISGQQLYPGHGDLRLFRSSALYAPADMPSGEPWLTFLVSERTPRDQYPVAVAGLDQPLTLGPCDATLICGPTRIHWRKGPQPGWSIHAFLHWRSDPDRLFAGRAALGLPLSPSGDAEPA